MITSGTYRLRNYDHRLRITNTGIPATVGPRRHAPLHVCELVPPVTVLGKPLQLTNLPYRSGQLEGEQEIERCDVLRLLVVVTTTIAVTGQQPQSPGILSRCVHGAEWTVV